MENKEKVSLYLEFCEKHKNILSGSYGDCSGSLGMCKVDGCFAQARFFGYLVMVIKMTEEK